MRKIKVQGPSSRRKTRLSILAIPLPNATPVCGAAEPCDTPPRIVLTLDYISWTMRGRALADDRQRGRVYRSACVGMRRWARPAALSCNYHVSVR